jgi:4-coumarate--CoA ligase
MNSEVCAVLCFSSGTTGLPKAVRRPSIPQSWIPNPSNTTTGHNIPPKHHRPAPPAPPYNFKGPHHNLGALPFYHSTSPFIPLPTTLRPLTKHPITGVVKLLTLLLILPSSVILLPHTPHSLPVLLSIISHSQIAEPQLVPPLISQLAHSPLIPTTTSHASNASLLALRRSPRLCLENQEGGFLEEGSSKGMG